MRRKRGYACVGLKFLQSTSDNNLVSEIWNADILYPGLTKKLLFIP